MLSGWVLFKLVHAIFIFPSYLQGNQAKMDKVYAKMEEKYKGLEEEEPKEPKKDK